MSNIVGDFPHLHFLARGASEHIPLTVSIRIPLVLNPIKKGYCVNSPCYYLSDVDGHCLTSISALLINAVIGFAHPHPVPSGFLLIGSFFTLRFA